MKKVKLGDILPYEQPTQYIVESTKYDDKYKTPVLTAGKTFLLGKTDEAEGIYTNLPCIIFDDFTTATKYVNFPFKVKSSAMKILTAANEQIELRYFYYLMQIIKVDAQTHKRFWISEYSKIDVFLPSLPEQQRIVDKIEELFSDLDSAVADLNKTKAQLKVYRQAVLKQAFEGDYPLCRLDGISSAVSGYAFKSNLYNENGKYTIVKIGNVKSGRLDFSRDLTLTNEVDDKILSKYLLRWGDCLITMTGSRNKRDYGYIKAIKTEQNLLLNQRVCAIRFDIDVAMPEFYEYYLSSSDFRNQFFSYETGNVGQGNVGIKAITETKVICPKIEMQKTIVLEIESRLSVCDKIEQTVNESLLKAESLRQSILKQAFEGKLVK